MKKNDRTSTLCWDCDRAKGFCCWSHELKPVKGWKAKRLERKPQDICTRYIVFACPFFKPDERLSPKGREKTVGKNKELLKKRNRGEKI